LLSLEADAQSTADKTTTCGSSTLEEVANVVKMISSKQQQNAEAIKTEMKDEIKDLKTLLTSGSVETNNSRLEAVVQKVKEEIKNEIEDEIREVKKMIASGCEAGNETSLEEVVRAVKEMKDDMKNETGLLGSEIKDMKALVVSLGAATNDTKLEKAVKKITEEIDDVKTLLVSGSLHETNDTRLEDVVREIKDKIDHEMDVLSDVVKDVKRLLAFVTLEPSKQALVFALLCEYLTCF